MPLRMVKEAHDLGVLNNDNIKHFKAVTDDFKYTESTEYLVTDLKKVCRVYGCTINDLLLAVFTT